MPPSLGLLKRTLAMLCVAVYLILLLSPSLPQFHLAYDPLWRFGLAGLALILVTVPLIKGIQSIVQWTLDIFASLFHCIRDAISDAVYGIIVFHLYVRGDKPDPFYTLTHTGSHDDATHEGAELDDVKREYVESETMSEHEFEQRLEDVLDEE